MHHYLDELLLLYNAYVKGYLFYFLHRTYFENTIYFTMTLYVRCGTNICIA